MRIGRDRAQGSPILSCMRKPPAPSPQQMFDCNCKWAEVSPKSIWWPSWEDKLELSPDPKKESCNSPVNLEAMDPPLRTFSVLHVYQSAVLDDDLFTTFFQSDLYWYYQSTTIMSRRPLNSTHSPTKLRIGFIDPLKIECMTLWVVQISEQADHI